MKTVTLILAGLFCGAILLFVILEFWAESMLGREHLQNERREGECKTCGGDEYLQPCQACGRGLKP